MKDYKTCQTCHFSSLEGERYCFKSLLDKIKAKIAMENGYHQVVEKHGVDYRTLWRKNGQ